MFDRNKDTDSTPGLEPHSTPTPTDALRVSERQYRRLFEAARDGILLLDINEGKITDANPFMTELLGYSHEELMGKQLWEIGLLKDKTAGQLAFQILKSSGDIRYENLPLENRFGAIREVEFVSNVYRENGHEVIQCNIRDITERKHVADVLAAAAVKNARIAETLQRSMLQTIPLSKFPRTLVKALYVAALNEAEVGGDFCDAFAMRNDKIALVVGDVSGKGLAAAGRTAEVKYALRAILHEYEAPEIALAHLNDFMCETHKLDTDSTETFVVMAVAVMDTATGEAAFSAAGAEPTLILRNTGIAEQVEIIGTPLGVIPNAVYVAELRRLEPGETIIIATDGITEARTGNQFLGVDGMAALAELTGPAATVSDLCDAIYGGAMAFAENSLRDDVCLLVAKLQ